MTNIDCLKVFKKIVNLRLIFGHYHRTDNSKYLLLLIRLYCYVFITTLFLIYFLLFPGPLNFNLNSTYIMVEVLINCLISVLFQGKYIQDLYVLIDNVFKILNGKLKISYAIYVSLIIFFLCRVYFLLIYTQFSINDFRLWLALIAFASLCVNYISKIIVFDVIYQSMKLTRAKLEFKYVYINVIGKTRVYYRIENIRTCLSVYQHLIQFIENINLEVQTWMLATLIISLPKTVTFMYIIMRHVSLYQVYGHKSLYSSILICIYTLAMVCAPSVLVELTAHEVDLMKNIVMNNKVSCADHDLLLEIQKASNYLKLVPLKCRVWRIIAINSTLPLKFVSVCFTYVIVLAQLNHIQF